MEHRVRRVATDEPEEVGRLTVEAYRDDGYIDADDEYLRELADAAYRDREAEVGWPSTTPGCSARSRSARRARSWPRSPAPGRASSGCWA